MSSVETELTINGVPTGTTLIVTTHIAKRLMVRFWIFKQLIKLAVFVLGATVQFDEEFNT